MWLPPKVSRELVEERQQYTAMLDETAVRDKMMHVKGLLDEATYRLRREFDDPLLEVVRAPGQVPIDSAMKPCYYVVIRWNEGAPPTVINIEGPNGEFVNLDGNIGAVVEMMRGNNMRDPENRRRIERAREDAKRADEKRKLEERAERQEELRDRINAATRTFVSMNRDQPWSQNVKGQRRRRTGS